MPRHCLRGCVNGTLLKVARLWIIRDSLRRDPIRIGQTYGCTGC